MKDDDQISTGAALLAIVFGFAWLFGIVVAKGFWATLFSITIPFVAWYLAMAWVVERFI